MSKKHKYSILNQSKISRAKEILGTRTDSETVEKALDLIISKAEKNKIAFDATEKLLKSGVKVIDVFGNLEK